MCFGVNWGWNNYKLYNLIVFCYDLVCFIKLKSVVNRLNFKVVNGRWE